MVPSRVDWVGAEVLMRTLSEVSVTRKESGLALGLSCAP